MPWRSLLSLCILLASASLVGAQDTGQICVAAFADRNGNGERDADEAPLSGGVGANVLDDQSVTIASGLLEDSPFAADGLLCLDGLAAGDYLVVLTSNQYHATTDSAVSASVEPGRPPARIDFGLSALYAEPARAEPANAFAIDAHALETVLVASLGGCITLAVMSGLGFFIYIFVFRRRLQLARRAEMRIRGGHP